MTKRHDYFLFISCLIIILFNPGCSFLEYGKCNLYNPHSTAPKDLYDTIVKLDSLMFSAYNNCKLETFEKLFDNDIEFYHDKGGLIHSKSEIIASTRKNICGKVSRELIKGSIEVHPIYNYGAIQIGLHRFYNSREKNGKKSKIGKFIHTWKLENGQWTLTRIISLH